MRKCFVYVFQAISRFFQKTKKPKKTRENSFLHFLSDFAIFQKPKKHWDSRKFFVYMFQAISQIFRTLLKSNVFCLHASSDLPNFFKNYKNQKITNFETFHSDPELVRCFATVDFDAKLVRIRTVLQLEGIHRRRIHQSRKPG